MFHGSMVCLRNTHRIESLEDIRIELWNCKKKKSNGKLIRVGIRRSNIYTFKQQNLAFLQFSNFSNLRFEFIKSDVLYVCDLI